MLPPLPLNHPSVMRGREGRRAPRRHGASAASAGDAQGTASREGVGGAVEQARALFMALGALQFSHTAVAALSL